MQMSEQITELAAAMAKAQGEIENASKNAANPHFRSKYADLAEVLNTVRPVFAKHGLAVIQSPEYGEGNVHVQTTIMHSSGQWMACTTSAPVSKQDAQGVGSAITYCRRYGLAAMAGIAQEDDDAQSAVAGPGKTRQQANPKPSKQDITVATDALEACATLDELKDTFIGLPEHVREAVTKVKDDMKGKLSQEAA